jgi:hypothetical protein
LNKKWRTLLHIHPKNFNIIINTQYPFDHTFAYKQIINKLPYVFKQKYQLHQLKTKSLMRKIVKDYNVSEDEPLHHNDLLSIEANGEYTNKTIDFYAPYGYNINHIEPIIVGNPPICPTCGEKIITNHDSLCCNNCSPFEYCSVCGVGYEAEELHLINGELYCDTCFDDNFFYCPVCDEIVSVAEDSLGLHKCTAAFDNEETQLTTAYI